MDSFERVSLPLIGGLVPDGIKPGTVLCVEFDPESQWFAIATTITARYLKMGFCAAYMAITRSVEEVEADLADLGVDVWKSKEAGVLEVEDWYSATLGLEPSSPQAVEQIQGQKGVRIRSLKVSDLSVYVLAELKHGAIDRQPGSLVMHESQSPLLRFNEEKSFLEFFESRAIPFERRIKAIFVYGIATGIQSDSFYKRLESMSDGVIEVRVLERGDEAKNFLRLRSLRRQPHDAQWHEVKIKSNGEASLGD